MNFIRMIGALALLTALTMSCEKDEPTLDGALKGKWALNEVTGGIHGQGYQPDFDLLEMDDNRYALRKEQETLSSGSVTYDADAEHGLVFRQEQHKEGFNQFVDQPKSVEFKGTDTLLLADPCCDLYAYRFVRASGE